MKVIVRAKAAADIEDIYSWIVEDNPRAAARIVRRLRDRIDMLGARGLAHIGRSGLVRGTREVVEAPYIIIYTVDDERELVTIIAIVHGARKR